MIHILEYVGVVLLGIAADYVLIMMGALLMLSMILNLFWRDW